MEVVKYNKALTGLRGVAFLYVFISHIGHNFDQVPFRGIGQFGVWLFFILSSFLLGKKIFIDISTNKFDFLNYIIKRFLRIYPLLLFYLIVHVFIVVFLLDQNTLIKSIAQILGILSLQYYFGHLWTIIIEFRYYFLIPFILAIGFKLRFNFIYLCSLFLISLFLYFIGIQLDWNPGFQNNSLVYNNFNFLSYFFLFFSGLISGIISTDLSKKFAVFKSKDKLLEFIKVVPSSFYFLLLALPCLASPRILDAFNINLSWTGYNSYFYIPFCILFPMLILYIESENLVSQFLSLRFLEFIGLISYPAYLFHPIVIKFFSQDILGNDSNAVYVSITLLVATIAISYFLHISIENSFMQYSSTLTKKISSKFE